MKTETKERKEGWVGVGVIGEAHGRSDQACSERLFFYTLKLPSFSFFFKTGSNKSQVAHELTI